jgi:hypothetical protein
MKEMIAGSMVLACLAVLQLGPAKGLAQQGKAAHAENKANESKNGKKKPPASVNVHIQVLAEGMDTLPQGSRIELKSAEEACGELQPVEKHFGTNGVTFNDLPKCKVKLNIFITGLEAKTGQVDLRASTGKMKVVVKPTGDPKIDWLPAS